MPENTAAVLESTEVGVPDDPRRAWTAWARLRPQPTGIPPVDTLQSKGKNHVYRIRGAAPDGHDLIAKCLREADQRLERSLYEAVLPHLPLPGVRYLGQGPDDRDGFYWIFLEAVEGVQYNSEDPSHRAAAGKWLGVMHSTLAAAAAGAFGRGELPDGGPSACAERLRRVCQHIALHQCSPTLCDDDRLILNDIVHQCEHLLARFEQLIGCCHSLPSTLVHGDFVPKNLWLQSGPAGETNLFVFDWEMACYGPPAADLAHCDDLISYTRELSGPMRVLCDADIRQLVLIGKIFRWAAYVDWAIICLSYEWGVEKAIRRLRSYWEAMWKIRRSIEQTGFAS